MANPPPRGRSSTSHSPCSRQQATRFRPTSSKLPALFLLVAVTAASVCADRVRESAVLTRPTIILAHRATDRFASRVVSCAPCVPSRSPDSGSFSPGAPLTLGGPPRSSDTITITSRLLPFFSFSVDTPGVLSFGLSQASDQELFRVTNRPILDKIRSQVRARRSRGFVESHGPACCAGPHVSALGAPPCPMGVTTGFIPPHPLAPTWPHLGCLVELFL